MGGHMGASARFLTFTAIDMVRPMCGRFSQFYTWREVHDFMELLPGVPWPESERELSPRLDIRPPGVAMPVQRNLRMNQEQSP